MSNRKAEFSAMRLLRSTLMTALAALALVGAPLAQVMVWCHGDDGHQAVELASHQQSSHHHHGSDGDGDGDGDGDSACRHHADHQHPALTATHHHHGDVIHYHGDCEDWQLGIDTEPTPTRPPTLISVAGAIAPGTISAVACSREAAIIKSMRDRYVDSTAPPPLPPSLTGVILLI